MSYTDLEKRIWLLEREVTSLNRKVDHLTKTVTSLRNDIKDFLSVQKTYMELMSADESRS